MGSPAPAIEDRQKSGESSRGFHPWTSTEIAQLRKLATLGAAEIAVVLGRSVRSVRRQAERGRISLRRPGSTGGRFMGQQGASTRAQRLGALRADLLAGGVDISRLERRARFVLGFEKDVCPACGLRPQETRGGFCTDCWYRALAEAHAMEVSTRTARRVMDMERQRRSRRAKE